MLFYPLPIIFYLHLRQSKLQKDLEQGLKRSSNAEC